MEQSPTLQEHRLKPAPYTGRPSHQCGRGHNRFHTRCRWGEVLSPRHELEDHVRGRITCTFIYSPTEATRGHTAPNIMFSSPRINGGIDNIIDERYQERWSGTVKRGNKRDHKGGISHVVLAKGDPRWERSGDKRT